MSKELKYICGISDYRDVAIAAADLSDFHEKANQEQEFLKARIKQLDSERTRKWEGLWSALRAQGAIDSSTSSSTHKLILGDNGKQIFIDTADSGGLLEKLFGGE